MQEGQEARALLIEADQELRQLLTKALQDEGFDVTAADSVFGIHALVRSQVPSVIVLDVELPYRSGMSLLPRLKADAQTADIPVVVVSALPDLLPESRRRMAAAIIPKPCSSDHVRTALQHARALSEGGGQEQDAAQAANHPAARTQHKAPRGEQEQGRLQG